MTACSGFGNNGDATDVSGLVWEGIDSSDFSTSNHCPQGGSFQILPSGVPKRGESVRWQTTTPASIKIVHAVTPVNEVLIDPDSGDGFNASFYWDGGSQTIWAVNNCCGGMYYGAGINRWLGPSRSFGWEVRCVVASCGQPLQILDVRGVDLVADDDTPPRLVASGGNNVWYQSGRWIRGSGWPASFVAYDDSGICAMQAIVDGRPIPGPSAQTRNTHSWTQCPTPQTMGLTIDTTQYPDGSVPLTLSAADAASPANVSSPSETLHVDNTPVGLSLTGPTDALSTAGTQYVTATATAGLSGVAGMDCSVDGSPYEWNVGTSAQIPVQGIGEHTVRCYAVNRAFNVYGVPANSPLESWSLSIRQPTIVSASFAKLVDALKCTRVTRQVTIPARWVTVVRHRKTVKVRRPAHKHKVRQTECRVRLEPRRERVDGHWRLVRVPVFPHVVSETTERVGFGKKTTVSGWLGLTNGTALAGQKRDRADRPE